MFTVHELNGTVPFDRRYRDGCAREQVIANLGSAVVFGCIFWRLGLGQAQINDRIGLLQVPLAVYDVNVGARTRLL